MNCFVHAVVETQTMKIASMVLLTASLTLTVTRVVLVVVACWWCFDYGSFLCLADGDGEKVQY